MVAPLSYVDAPTLAGSWPILPEASPFGASVLPRTLRVRATIIGIQRETSAGFDAAGKSFLIDVDSDLGISVSLTGPGSLTLDDLVSQINTAVSPTTGFDVAFKDNGFLKLQSATPGEDSYLALHTDAESGPQVFTDLGLFSETESWGGELESAPQLDPDRQTIPPGQMLMAEGETFDTRVINRTMLQIAINSDKLSALWNKKRYARTVEITRVDPGQVFELIDTVYTGTVAEPSEDQLSDIMVLLDEDGVEPILEKFTAGTPVSANVAPNADTGELVVTAAGATFNSSHVKNPWYVVIDDAGMGTLDGKPLKIVQYISTTQVVVRNVDDSGNVQTPTVVGVTANVRARSFSHIRVKGLWDTVAKDNRVEGEVTPVFTSAAINRIEKNNRLISTDEAVDFTSQAAVGDLIVISGHTASVPFSNNGTYRVAKIIDEKSVELVLEDFGPAFLHGSGTALGTFDLQHDEAFYLNPWVELTEIPPAGTYRIVYMKASSFTEITDDLTAFATPPLRYQQEADDTIHEAIRRVLGPSAVSYKDILHSDYRFSLEDIYFRLDDEHDVTGRHSSIRPNVVDLFPGQSGETFIIRADAGEVAGDVKMVLRNGSDTPAFQLHADGSVEATYGSVTQPGYTFLGDHTVGMYRSGTGQLSLSSGGSETLRLDLLSDAHFTRHVFVGGVGVLDDSAYGDWGLYEVGVGELGIATFNETTGLMKYGEGTLVIDAANNKVGILTGTTPPAYDLEVNGTVVLSGGNLGIGEAPGTHELHIGVNQNSATGISVSNYTAGALARSEVALESDDVGVELTCYSTVASGTWAGETLAGAGALTLGGSATKMLLGTGGSYPLHFATNSDVRMTIDDAGQVGIGTTNPKQRLHVVGDVALFTHAETDEVAKNVRLAVEHWTSSEEPVALITGLADEESAIVSLGGGSGILNAATELRLFTAANPNTLNGTVRMTIQNDGEVGIGISGPAARLHVHETTLLGGTLGNYQAISTESGLASGNTVHHRQWLYRDFAGADWNTANWFDGIGIDTSYLVPMSTARCWWNRDPSAQKQTWGTGAATYLTIENGGNVILEEELYVDNSASYRLTAAETYYIRVDPWEFSMKLPSITFQNYALYSTYQYIDTDVRVMPLLWGLKGLRPGHVLRTIAGRHYRWAAQIITYSLKYRDPFNTTTTTIGTVSSPSSATGWETITSSNFNHTVIANRIYWIEATTSIVTAGLNQRMFGGFSIEMGGDDLELTTTG